MKRGLARNPKVDTVLLVGVSGGIWVLAGLAFVEARWFVPGLLVWLGGAAALLARGSRSLCACGCTLLYPREYEFHGAAWVHRRDVCIRPRP